jgi:asparagine synthase (glutamine-hydrolysing)
MDIASMAHGLEVRSPFMDHPLVEWIAGLPQETRMLNGTMKGLLKQAIEPLLPPGIIDRAKMGFRVPVGAWMQNQIKPVLSALLLNDRFHDRGLLRPAFVEQLIEQHGSGKEDHSTRLWTLLMLELWFITFIDNDGERPVASDVFATA